MLPHTHFLVALVLGLIGVHTFLFTHAQAVILGIISTSIDIDHLFAYHKRHKKWSIKGTWEAAIVKHEQEKSFIQHPEGVIIASIVILILFFIDAKWALLLTIAYFTHYILDHIHINLKNKKIKKIGGLHVPVHKTETMIAIIFLVLAIILW
jgi:hypothetical protein